MTKEIVLDSTEIETERLGTVKERFPYTDYSSGSPEDVVFVVDMKIIAGEYKRKFVKLCTKKNADGIPELDFERYAEELTLVSLGWTRDMLSKFLKTHSLSLWTSISIRAQQLNDSNLAEELEEIKNEEGQDQPTIS